VLFEQESPLQSIEKRCGVAYNQNGTRYKQRWLVLAHAFNMDGRAASQTITDKLQHLEAAGIELVILSGVSGSQDGHFEHYQIWPAAAAGIRFELRHVLRQRLKSKIAYRMVMLVLTMPLLPFISIEKLFRPVESSWSWSLSATLKALSLARTRKFDLIYSTGGAFAAHVAGHVLKQALGIRWLAEIHDPLVMPGKIPKTAQEKMQAKVERKVCEEADIAIWFTDQALASAKARNPKLGERGRMMLPGIDPPFQEMPPYVPGPKLVLGHFGSLSATRSLKPVIAALEALVRVNPLLNQKLELHVTGGPLDKMSQTHLARSPVAELVRNLGRIEADPVSGLSGRNLILNRMRSVDVLLLLHGTEPICSEYIPSKLYEYLWMQRPILAIVSNNIQMKELLNAGGHWVIEWNDPLSEELVVQKIADVIKDLYERWEKMGLPSNGRDSPYTTATSVKQLINWVNG